MASKKHNKKLQDSLKTIMAYGASISMPNNKNHYANGGSMQDQAEQLGASLPHGGSGSNPDGNVVPGGGNEGYASYQGRTHDEGGIPIGESIEVEDGEFKYEDMVFSNRIPFDDKGKETYADQAKRVHKKYAKRLGNFDGKATKAANRELENLFQQQEIAKQTAMADFMPQDNAPGIAGGRDKLFIGAAISGGLALANTIGGSIDAKKKKSNAEQAYKDNQLKFAGGVDPAAQAVAEQDAIAAGQAELGKTSKFDKAMGIINPIAGAAGSIAGGLMGGKGAADAAGAAADPQLISGSGMPNDLFQAQLAAYGGRIKYGLGNNDPTKPMYGGEPTIDENFRTYENPGVGPMQQPAEITPSRFSTSLGFNDSGTFGMSGAGIRPGETPGQLQARKDEFSRRTKEMEGWKQGANHQPEQGNTGQFEYTPSELGDYTSLPETRLGFNDGNVFGMNTDFGPGSTGGAGDTGGTSNTGRSRGSGGSRSGGAGNQPATQLNRLNLSNEPEQINMNNFSQTEIAPEAIEQISDGDGVPLGRRLASAWDSPGLTGMDLGKYGLAAYNAIRNKNLTSKPKANEAYTQGMISDGPDFRNAEAYNQIDSATRAAQQNLMNTGNMGAGAMRSNLVGMQSNAARAKSQVAAQDLDRNMSEDLRRKYANVQIQGRNLQEMSRADMADRADQSAYEDTLRSNLNNSTANFMNILTDAQNRQLIQNSALKYGASGKYKGE